MLDNEYQYHIKLKHGDVAKYVFLTGDPGRCEKIAEYLEDPVFVGTNREYTTYNGKLNGEMVTVMSTGIGGPSAAIAIEELVKLGGEIFIRIGTCGGMQSDVVAGDVVIATGAIRMEGTSREYLPIEFPAVADFTVVSALVKACSELDCAYHTGVVQSKDSFYGQHSPEIKPVSYELLSKWEAWIKGGALASEMECAALFTVAAYLRVKVGAILHVVNNQEREKQCLPNTYISDMSNCIKAAINAMKEYISQDLK